jgi:hypothetical protein
MNEVRESCRFNLIKVVFNVMQATATDLMLAFNVPTVYTCSDEITMLFPLVDEEKKEATEEPSNNNVKQEKEEKKEDKKEEEKILMYGGKVQKLGMRLEPDYKF